MPWFKVDDTLHAHPKARRAGKSAMGLWTLAGSYCMAYKLDGQVDAEWISTHRGKADAAHLVEAGFWHALGHDCDDCPQPTDPEGFVFHDWFDSQPSAEEIEKDREAARERQRRFRERRREPKEPTNVTPLVTRDKPVTQRVSHSTPSLPVPTLPYPTKEPQPSVGSRSPRGSRINEDWQPSEKCHDDLGAEYADLDLALELDAFRDHWLSKGECRKDWNAAFRNWCRNARKYNTRAAPAKKRTNGLSDEDWQAAFERAQAADRIAELERAAR